MDVNGRPVDNIPTASFASVHLGRGEYFVMGDNPSASEDRAYSGVAFPQARRAADRAQPTQREPVEA